MTGRGSLTSEESRPRPLSQRTPWPDGAVEDQRLGRGGGPWNEERGDEPGNGKGDGWPATTSTGEWCGPNLHRRRMYLHSPYEEPVVGLDEIRQMREGDRDG
jgi:hypothetical protein